MNINLFNLFDIDNKDKVVFFNKNTPIYISQFQNDVIKYFFLFNKINNKKVLLYINDNNYLFFVCFLALLQCDKDIILPACFTKNLRNISLKDNDFIITNEDIDYSNNLFINISKPSSYDTNIEQNFIFKKDSKSHIYFFTSGSTAEPKKIERTMTTLYKDVNNFYNTFKTHLNPNCTIIASVVPYHFYGMICSLLLPLCFNIVLDLDIIVSLDLFKKKQELYDHIIFVTQPSFLEKMILYASTYKPLDAIFSSGALLDKNVSESVYEKLGFSPIELFGSTETGGIAFRQRRYSEFFEPYSSIDIDVDEDGFLLVKSSFIEEGFYKMKDKVQLQKDKKFLFLGRADRLVKIYEKRISLPEMEKIYETHPFIKKAYIILLSPNTLGLVISLTKQGSQFLKENDKSKLLLSIRTYMLEYFDSSTLPKKVRITFDIPTNSQGKILSKDIDDLFSNNVQEPIVNDIKICEKEIIISLTFLKDSIYFQGHFPNYPLTPGVVQLHFVIYFMKKFWNININDYNIVKLKFSNMIFPEEAVNLKITQKNNNLIFEYLKDETMCSSGLFSKKEK